MKAELLHKAVTEDLTETLKDVCLAAYSLEELSSLEMVTIAQETNKKLGYNLFEDLYKPRLILDFARVARAVQVNALKSK